MHDFPIVSLLIFLPVAGALLCLAVPRQEERTARYLSLTVALVAFFASVPLYFGYDVGPEARVFQFAEHAPWVQQAAGTEIGLAYSVGLDGL